MAWEAKTKQKNDEAEAVFSPRSQSHKNVAFPGFIVWRSQSPAREVLRINYIQQT
jgi:hypothetical protein